MRHFPCTAAFLAASLLAAQVGLASEACLNPSQIEGVVGAALHDSHSVVVRTHDGKLFLVGISGWCHDLDFKASNLTSTCLRAGDWYAAKGDEVKYTGGTLIKSTGTRCIITKVTPYQAETDTAAPAAPPLP